MDIIMKILEPILYVVVTVAVPIVVAELKKYLSTKTANIVAGIEDSKKADLISNAEAIVEKVVTEVTQTYVDEVKKEGSFNDNAQKVAKTKALAEANDLISKEAQEVITQVYKNFDKWLDVTIESVIQNTK